MKLAISANCHTAPRHTLLAWAVANALGLAGAAQAATITVTDAGDAGGSACTLRQALEAANSNAAVAGCAAGGAIDTINFAANLLPATITLTGGELTVSSELTIQGPSTPDQLTIAGAGSRLLQIDDTTATTVAVTLSGLTLRDGQVSGAGGAINNQEDLTLSNCELLNNSATPYAGAIFNNGTLTIVGSTISGNQASTTAANSYAYGGAIINRGTLNMTDSIVSGNTVVTSGDYSYAYGGGLDNYSGTATISSSTLSGNTASATGIEASGDGGAIDNAGGTLTITNSTLSGNDANRAGAIRMRFSGRLNLTHATIVNNTAPSNAGVSLSGGTAELRNTVIANNVGDVDCGGDGDIAVNLNNLIGVGTCSQNAVNRLTGDPGLDDALQDNGGPTSTHAILPLSQLTEAGDTASCAPLTTDQTGAARSADGDSDGGAICDIGAFEFVDGFGPQALVSLAPDVSAPGATSYQLVIDYSDDAQVDADSFDINDVQVTPGPLAVTAINVVGDSVTYTLTPPGGAWDFTDNASYSIALRANQVFDLALPSTNAAPAGTLGNFEVAIAEIDVSGQGIGIVDGDSTPSISDDTQFGQILLNASETRTFTITNRGAGSLELAGPITIAGAGFSVTQPAVTSLGAGASTDFDVTFMPATEGAAGGTVTINSNDADESPYTFAVAGEGILPEIDVSGNGLSIADGDTTPSATDDTELGNVALNGRGSSVFTITNAGSGEINLTGPLTITGTGFSITQPTSTTLGAGETANFEVSFVPAAAGPIVGTVTIQSNDADESPYTFRVRATGVTTNSAPTADDAAFGVLVGAPTDTVIGQVNATDPENNILPTGGWQIIAGNDSDAFAIGDDGTITVGDASALTDATLTVQVTDGGGLSDTATVTITILSELMFSDGFEGP